MRCAGTAEVTARSVTAELKKEAETIRDEDIERMQKAGRARADCC